MNLKNKEITTIKLPGAVFLISYVIIFLPLIIINTIYSKEVIHLAINNYHNPFLDFFMKYWTYLGDGSVDILLIILLLLISLRYFFTTFTAFAFGGLGAQLIKRLLFHDIPRPVKFFELYFPEYHLYLVPGVKIHTWLSFPSGHAATAFAVCTALAFMSKSKFTQLLLFILAVGVAYSRVYLSQHFLVDVIAGSFLGIIMGWLSWHWMNRYEVNWMESSLLSLFKK
jgi:membrane-associated phospholipid phosphatase